MRLATYNVEWFHQLFADDGTILDDAEWSGRQDVVRRDQLAALGIVFSRIDADAIMVIEAPDCHGGRDGVRALENFATRFGLRARKAVVGFVNDTQQEIMLLHDPDVLTARHDPRGEETGKKGTRDAPRFDSVFRIDLDIDAQPDLVRWSKPPLELEIETAGGRRLRMIGVHAKSKAPHGARDPKEIMRVSIANRRKQMAQCVWLRQRIEDHLSRGDSLIVLGDFNDGPGLDEYEKLFGRSSIEIVTGENGGPRLFDPHARRAVSQPLGARPTTARFYIQQDEQFLQALLDYIMVSEDLLNPEPNWRIWHPFDDPECFSDLQLREGLLTASDHFPVTIDIDL